MRVLIVEDQPIIITTLSNLILELYPEAEIDSTSSTTSALVLLKQFKFDLIISDLDFNGEKRFSVVDLAKTNQIKCIVYTAHYNLAFINKAIELKVAAFVSKHGSIDDLMFALKNYQTIDNYICSFCVSQNKEAETNEILFPDLKGIEEHILDMLLIQTPRKEIAKTLNITADSLNTYINRMTAKNNCNLLVLCYRYIVWKRSKS